jgi:hypothetical protein
MTILPNQSVLDAVLTQYGSLDAAIAFCIANNIPISHLPAAGTQYAAPSIKGNKIVQQYLESRDIEIGTAGSMMCGRVHSLELISVTTTSVTFSFIAGDGAIALQWGIGEEEPETLELIGITETSLTVEGLLPSTSSKFWIRTVCNGSVSIWNIMAFATEEIGYHHSIVLRPVRMHVSKDPDATYGYVLNYAANPAFENIYPLLEDWQSPNYLLYHTKEQIDAYGALHALEPIALTPSSGNMVSKTAQFVSHTLSLPGTTYLWNTHEGGLPDDLFPRFIDAENNRAACAPVVVYDTLTDTLYPMLGTMTLGTGHTAHGLYILPVTIAHDGDNPFFEIMGMKLLRRVPAGYDFVAMATPGTTILAELTPGRHELLLCVSYRSVDAIDIGPVSFNAVVIDVSL